MFGPFGTFGMRFDWPEFFVGLAVGTAAALVLSRFLPVFSWVGKWARSRIQALREGLMAGARDAYRVELVKRAETLHVSRAIFALNEIVIPPCLLAPPIPTDPLRSDAIPENSLGVLPNLPDCAYLSAIYRAPTISLANAVADGSSFMITGAPGSGKTTALAYVASRLAQGAPEFGEAASKLPVLVSALDLELDPDVGDDPLEPIVAVVQRLASAGLAPRIPGYLRLHFGRGRAVLLLDGVDQMTSEEIEGVKTWLEALEEDYPSNQIIAAGPRTGYDGLVMAGLFPVLIAPWTEHDQRKFLDRWASAWQRYLAPNLPQDRLDEVDPTLINGWLVGTLRGLSPLELTLRVWGCYAGDTTGAELTDSFEGFLRRFMSEDERKSAAAAAKAWIENYQGAVPDRVLPRGTPVNDMLDAGILVRRSGNRLSFFQPSIGTYLAALALAETPFSEDVDLSSLDLFDTLISFCAALGDVSTFVERHLDCADDPTAKPILSCGVWLRDAPRRLDWRGQVLRGLAQILLDPRRPYGLRLRIVHVLVRADEPQVAQLFRRMLASESQSSRVLAALGLGGMKHLDTLERLGEIIGEDPDLRVRQAACLALASIGTDRALEILGNALLGGEEPLRLAAAEALACHPDEGYVMLREAIDDDELLTRRAAVFGLARVPEAWALTQLERVQVEDSQWVVRGAAAEALERRKNSPWQIPEPVKDLSELPWLVAFAARQGLGVAPGKAAYEMVRRALGEGTLQERTAAMEAIGWTSAGAFCMELYQALNGAEDSLRDSAYEALWRLSAAGVELPEPAELGLD